MKYLVVIETDSTRDDSSPEFDTPELAKGFGDVLWRLFANASEQGQRVLVEAVTKRPCPDINALNFDTVRRDEDGDVEGI